jgi:raffinose/stachyose/melibiose transport system permease protein
MTAGVRLLPRHFGVKLLLTSTLLLWLVPTIYMVSVAFRPIANVFDPTLIEWSFTLENFRTILHENNIARNFLNSLVITCGTVLLVVAAASMFAYALAVLRLRWLGVVYAILLTTLMMPITALVLPLAIMLKGFGWINDMRGLILPYAALGIPFAIVVLRGFFEDSPRALFEAALIDGCSAWQMYLRVALPMVRPAIAFVAIWQFIVSWNEFFLALIVMTDPDHKTLTLVPMQYSGLYMANPGALFAILVLIAAPLILLYVLVQRQFVAGLLAGAVKE